MKITKIEQEGNIFSVTLKPNFVEKLFGYKEKIKKYRKTYSTFTFGGGNVYVNEKGEKLENGNWIAEELDKHQNKF